MDWLFCAFQVYPQGPYSRLGLWCSGLGPRLLVESSCPLGWDQMAIRSYCGVSSRAREVIDDEIVVIQDCGTLDAH